MEERLKDLLPKASVSNTERAVTQRG